MPTSHRGHGWTARSRCSAWSDGRGGLPHSRWEGTGSVWSPRGPRERLRQTPSVSGDDAETEGRPRQPALRRVRIRRVWVFSVKAPLGVCRCVSSAPISQGGRVGWTSSECRRSGVAGGGGPRPCPARAASSPPGPLVLLTDRVTASAGLPAPEPLSGTGKSLPRPPDTLPSALRGSIVPDICQGFWKSRGKGVY